MTKTAVVILNYNGEKLLRQFLPSVIRYSPEAEIIVVDNGSTDQSVFILKKDFPQIRLILFTENYGFCGGYNRALKQIDATYILLLNSDIEVTPHWLTPLVKLLDDNDTIAAVQPKILSFHSKTKFEYAGAAGGFIDSLGYPYCRGRIFSHVETDNHQYDDERQIFWATGACLLVRAEVYRKFGGLDEDFFAHMEEIDLCWKINRTRQQVYYCGKSVVYHVGAGTLGYENPKKTYLNFRNGLMMILKHLDSGEMMYKLPFRLLLDWLALVVYALKGEYKNSLAVLRAHLHFFGSMRHTYKKREHIRSQWPTYSRMAIHRGSILVDYYLKKKKLFSNPR